MSVSKQVRTISFSIKPLRMAFGLAVYAGCIHTSIAQEGFSSVSQTLDEILVTAQKREQNINTVGITMSVIGSEELIERNLQNLQDVTSAISNVELFEDVSGAGIPTWIIRGVGLQDFNSNNTPTAAIYVDESYQPSTVMGGVGLFDVNRIEVLKGPQGGLYGRNTSGGAVLFNTQRALLNENSGFANISMSRWDGRGIEGASNFSLSSNLAMRISGRLQKSGDSWQKSLADDNEHGEKDRWDLRSWLNFEPADGLSIQWKIQAGEDNSEIMLGRSVGYYDGTGGICTAVLEGRRDDESCLSWAALNLLFQGGTGNDVATQSPDGSYVLSDSISRLDNTYLSNLLVVKKQFSNFELSSITAMDHFEYNVVLDLDASSGEYAHRFSGSEIDVLSQEFRITSSGNSSVSWLAGLNFSKESFEERRNFMFRDNFLVIQDIGLSFGNIDYDQDTSSASAYGNLSYRINSQWSLNASLRYTDEDKEYRNGSLYIPLPTPIVIYSDLSRDYNLDSQVAGSIGLNWRLSDELFAYGLISQGFKSGGFYGGFPLSPEEIDPYAEETITAYELGLKSSFSDQGIYINGAIFYYDYSDVQGFVTKISDITATPIDVLSNQGDAEHYGAELEFFWQAQENFTLDISIAYLSAKYTGATALTSNIFGDLVSISGRRPYAPTWSGGFNANYQLNFAQYFRSVTSLSYHYRTDFSGSQNTAAEEAINHLEGYGVLNGRVTINDTTANWQIALWVNNLLDKDYVSRVKNDGLRSYSDYFGEPRSMGVTLEYKW